MKIPCYFRAASALILLSFISCKKDENPASSPLTGDWKFVSLHSISETSIEQIVGPTHYKSVSTAEYTTTDNSGTISFAGSSLNANGIAYNMSAVSLESNYVDDQLTDTTSVPYSFNQPPISTISEYELVGSDSIRILGNQTFGAITSQGTQNNPTYKFSILGNTLSLSVKISKDTAFQDGSSLHLLSNDQMTLERN